MLGAEAGYGYWSLVALTILTAYRDCRLLGGDRVASRATAPADGYWVHALILEAFLR